MKCRGQLVSVLLYADYRVILVEDEKSMKLGLDTLAEWCKDGQLK